MATWKSCSINKHLVILLLPLVQGWGTDLKPCSYPCRTLPVKVEVVEVEVRPRQKAQRGVSPALEYARAIDLALRAGQTRVAIENLDRLLQLPNSRPAVLNRVGARFAQYNLYEYSLRAFEKSAREHPQNFNSQFNRALAYFALGRLREADQSLMAIRQPAVERLAPYFNLLGKIRAAMDQPDEAEQHLRKAHDLAPDEENYALDLGLHYINSRRYREALSILERSSQFHPDSAYILVGIALANYLSGFKQKALETCQRALDSDPDFSPARLLTSFSLYMGGNLQETEKVTLRGLAGPNPDPFLYYLHAVSLLKLQSGNFDRMLDEMTRAIQGIPSCALCYFQRSKVHQKKGDLLAASSDLQRAVTLDHNYSDAWYRLAMVYDRLGKAQQATWAREQFSRLKTLKSDRETDLLQRSFMKSLGVASPASKSR